jgi:dTDP-4-dehydrorhamnose reductase
MPIDDRQEERNLIDKLVSYPRVINVQNSMTTVPHVIEAIKKMIGRRLQGVYNLVNPGTISALDIMGIYQDIVNPTHRLDVMSIEELDSITPGKRSNCYLDTGKLKSEGIQLPEIHEAVRECLLKYKEEIK